MTGETPTGSLYLAAAELVGALRRRTNGRLRPHRGPTGGDQLGLRRGAGVEFADHRAYAPGDDLRRLDWRAYARQDKLFIKRFDQSVHNTTLVMLDASASMNLADPVDGGDVDKWWRVRVLAAATLLYVSESGQPIGLRLTHPDHPRTLRGSPRELITALETLSAAGSVDLSEGQIHNDGAAWASVMAMSDCLSPPEDCVRALAHLRRHGANVVLCQTMHPLELGFDFGGPVNLECPESGDAMQVQPALIGERYRQMMRDHCQALKTCCHSGGIRHQLVDLGQSQLLQLSEALTALRQGGRA